MITPLITNQIYEALLDDNFNINLNEIIVPLKMLEKEEKEKDEKKKPNVQKSLIIDLSKKDYDKNNNKLKEYLRLMDKNLEKNKFIVGNNLTLADIELFNSLRFLMMFHLPEALRKKLIPNLNKWFEKIMNTKEAIEAYGRTVLCKNMLKPFSGKICKKNLENINDKKVEKRDKEEKDSKDENKGKKNEKPS